MNPRVKQVFPAQIPCMKFGNPNNPKTNEKLKLESRELCAGLAGISRADALLPEGRVVYWIEEKGHAG